MTLGAYPLGQQVIKSEPTSRYCETFEATDPASDSDWYLSLGTGQTATKTSGTNGAYYTFASGTTANSETIFLLKKIFTGEFNVVLAFDRSAQTTNTNFYVELVEIDPNLIYLSPATAVITSGTDAPVKNARNAFSIFMSGATSAAVVNNRFGGATSFQYTSSHFLGLSPFSAPQGTSPNQSAGNIYELKANNYGLSLNRLSVANAASSLGAFTANAGYPSSGVLGTRYDPTKYYTIRVRMLNGGTNPASSVNFNFYRCEVFANNVIAVDVFRGLNVSSNGQQTAPTSFPAAQSLPVSIQNTPLTVTGQGGFTINSGSISTLTNGIPVFTTQCLGDDSSANLGVSGVYTGALSAAPTNYFGVITWRATVFSDVASTTNGLELQIANNAGTTWYTIATATANANSLTVLEQKTNIPSNNMVGRTARVRYTNGTTAQTVFAIRLSGVLS